MTDSFHQNHSELLKDSEGAVPLLTCVQQKTKGKLLWNS